MFDAKDFGSAKNRKQFYTGLQQSTQRFRNAIRRQHLPLETIWSVLKK